MNLRKAVKFHDPLIMMNNPDFLARPNPITEKYYILTRDIDESIVKGLQPNAGERKIIDDAIDQPDFQPLSVEAKATIWRFRYSLLQNKRAIVKFLHSVDWKQDSEKEEALKLLSQWCEFDIEQALPLLSSDFCANNLYEGGNKDFHAVRSAAVKCLDFQAPSALHTIML